MNCENSDVKNVIKLAKKWNNSTTNYNKIQFLDSFNLLSDEDQQELVKQGSPLSKILIGWCAAVRMEIKEQQSEV